MDTSSVIFHLVLLCVNEDRLIKYISIFQSPFDVVDCPFHINCIFTVCAPHLKLSLIVLRQMFVCSLTAQFRPYVSILDLSQRPMHSPILINVFIMT